MMIINNHDIGIVGACDTLLLRITHTHTVRIGGRAHAHAIRTRTLMKAAHIRLVGSFQGMMRGQRVFHA